MPAAVLATFLFILTILSPLAEASEPARAVDTNANGWFMYFGDHPIQEGPWGVHLEGQWRRHDVVTQWQQLLLRPAVNYEVSTNVMLTAGYGFINTYPYGGFPAAARFPEHRIFQQAVLKHSASRARFQHRYRLEQRYIGEVSLDERGAHEVDRFRYENRFRYMFRSDIPLRGSSVEKGDWYLALYDEVMVNFGRNVAANIFDQNRAYAALGHRTFHYTRIEFGYLNQLVQQRNGRVLESNHTLQVAVFSNLPFGRNGKNAASHRFQASGKTRKR